MRKKLNHHFHPTIQFFGKHTKFFKFEIRICIRQNVGTIKDYL